MPDSDWKTLKGDDAKRLEQELNGPRKDLPPVGGKEWVRQETLDPPEPPAYTWTNPDTGETETHKPDQWDCTRTITFSLLFKQGVAPPAPVPVTQYCDQCTGHTDYLVNSQSQIALSVPFTKAHVGKGQYGHREGKLYQRYRISGTVLKRTDRITKFVPKGDGAQFDSVQTGDQLASVTWQRKSIDHVEQGPFIQWLSAMSPKNCKTGLSEDYGLYQGAVEESLLAALRETGLSPELPLLNDGEAIHDLLTLASELKEAAFFTEWNEDQGMLVTLANLSEDGKTQEIGVARIEQHEGGFCTIENWKPGKKKATKGKTVK